MRFLVTGTAGFIGFHLAERLLDLGHAVTGVDAFTSYYDVALKRARARRLARWPNYVEHAIFLEDRDALGRVWAEAEPDVVIHLAAQAGVRYSLENPRAYLESNIGGTYNLLELLRSRPVRHFLFASTSSVYGCNTSVPFREIDQADHPLSFYAATKRSTELMAHSFAHLWNIPSTALRFFTVYGPWGRPDMAPCLFLKRIVSGQPIDIYNNGQMSRDFTFIGDVVEAVMRLIDRPPPKVAEREHDPAIPNDSLSPIAPFRVVNVGGGTPIDLMHFIDLLERAVGKPAQRRFTDMQPGDVPVTFADARLLQALTEYRPSTSLAEGIGELVRWHERDGAL